MSKAEGQAAISRIIEIRQFYDKSKLNNKKEYAAEFKQCIIKIVRYLK